MANGPNNNPITPQKTGLPSRFFAIKWHTMALTMNTDTIIMVIDMTISVALR